MRRREDFGVLRVEFGFFLSLFLLHSSVLEPDFDLALGETGSVGQLVPLLLGDVRVGQIFFFEQISDPFLVRLSLRPTLATRSARVEEVRRVCGERKKRLRIWTSVQMFGIS